jgi:hypothetical protein
MQLTTAYAGNFTFIVHTAPRLRMRGAAPPLFLFALLEWTGQLYSYFIFIRACFINGLDVKNKEAMPLHVPVQSDYCYVEVAETCS